MIALLFLWLGLAQAARDVQVCGQWTPDLTTAIPDGDGVDTNGDGINNNDVSDFLYDNTPLKANGLLALLQYREWAPSTAPQNSWTNGWVGHLEVGGADGGCTPVVSLPGLATSHVEVRVRIYSSFQAPDQGVMQVHADGSTNAVSEHLGPVTDWLVGDPVRKTVALGSGDSQMDVAIILATALDREAGGVTGLDWTIINADYPGGKGKIVPADEEIWVGQGSNVRRMLHELGHALTWQYTSWDKSYAWRNRQGTDSVCWTIPASEPTGKDGSSTHSSASDEATSAAIVEGFATYYAAQTVNKVNEGDCYILEDNPKDWDHDPTTTIEQEWYSCDIAPAPISTLSDGDYWADMCGYPGTDDYIIASEYDWLRGFWDLDTAGYSFTDMLLVFIGADPDGTFSDPWVVGYTYDPATEADDRPHVRMADSAAAVGWLTQSNLAADWATEGANNGMYR